MFAFLLSFLNFKLFVERQYTEYVIEIKSLDSPGKKQTHFWAGFKSPLSLSLLPCMQPKD